jgi:hypothetical protein
MSIITGFKLVNASRASEKALTSRLGLAISYPLFCKSIFCITNGKNNLAVS